ncbi:putative disease resistance protein RGA3 [Musa acuminata AAA Group]|uniref:putative disease resistance protein RGA3 n=1 Tax=Musa acuminata AAA Group TaxID=214697 RepID=UPI0031DE55EA
MAMIPVLFFTPVFPLSCSSPANNQVLCHLIQRSHHFLPQRWTVKMETSKSIALAADVRRLKTKAACLAKNRSMQRLCLSCKLSCLVDSLWIIQWACEAAEKQPEHEKNVETWVKDLEVAVLRADDILDMIKFGQLPRGPKDWVADAARELFYSIPPVLNFVAGCRLKSAVRKFEGMANEAKVRVFSKEDSSQSDAALLPAIFYGREENKEEIIRSLNHGERVAVIPIVGMAGTGKSTFARYIYSDQRRNFDVRMLVGRNFSNGAAAHPRVIRGRPLPLSELSAARGLIVREEEQDESQPPLDFAVTDREGHPSLRRFDNADRFQSAVEKIRQSLVGVRFLLVLLDVNVARPNLWERLMQVLREVGGNGSTVILTTTDTDIESTTQSRPSCSLPSLTREESWRLFKEHASLHHLPDKHHFWNPWIIEECHGHPLSVIIMAKKMRCRPVREYLLPDLSQFGAPRVSQDLPRLSSDLKRMYDKLTYDHERSLVSEKLHNCFTFLSLFPEDHHFCREEIVDLWAAENSMSLEEADGCFEAFMREGAFVLCEPQDEHDHESTPRGAAYKLRDLLPYFAQHVSSRKVYLTLSPGSFDLLQLDQDDDPRICQHLSFICEPESSGFPTDLLFQGPPWWLRTLLLLGPSTNEKCWVRDINDGNKAKTFQFLRVLHVRGITFRDLLPGVEKSKLVYLNVSRSDIEELPDSIGTLSNIKILKLSHCEKLRRFPKTIDRLRRLEKLDLEGCLLLAEVSFNWVGKLSRLEYLNLSQIGFKSLISSIGKLRGLKTLILAYCRRIQRLPKSTSKLLNLEKLDLEGCHFLEELPESKPESVMKNLKLLNTLHCASLSRMPSDVGRLSSLKSLPRYIASEEPGRSFMELQPLKDLEGELWLDKLNNIEDPEVARQAMIEKKEKLQALTLRWEQFYWDVKENAPVDTVKLVADALQPNPNLRSLKLILYTEEKLPSWMTEEPLPLKSLLRIRLFTLKKCKSLPPLGELPHLKVVEISGMDAVVELEGSFYGRIGTFPSLERLALSQMPNLKRWSMPEDDDADGNNTYRRKQVRKNLFPRLAHVTFMQCPKLEPPDHPLPSITTLTIWLNNEKLYRSAAGLKSMASHVKKLSVFSCQDLWASSTCDGFWGLTSLEELEISACDNLTCMPEGINQLTSLQNLKIICCRSMNSLPEWLNDLTSLRLLSFSACPVLRSRPRGLKRSHGLRVTVEGCPFLK